MGVPFVFIKTWAMESHAIVLACTVPIISQLIKVQRHALSTTVLLPGRIIRFVYGENEIIDVLINQPDATIYF